MELLISLGLLALIAAGMVAGLGLGLRVFERGEKIELQATEVTYRLRIRSWLAGAVSPGLDLHFPVSFEGKNNSLEFITLVETPYFPEAAALRVKVLYRDRSLSFVAEAIDDEGSTLGKTEGLLARNVADAQFEYLVSNRSTLEWIPDWSSDKAVPLAVKISAKPGSTPDWPEFVVRLNQSN